jgi:hypothetical protein
MVRELSFPVGFDHTNLSSQYNRNYLSLAFAAESARSLSDVLAQQLLNESSSGFWNKFLVLLQDATTVLEFETSTIEWSTSSPSQRLKQSQLHRWIVGVDTYTAMFR